jgi:hypothetical protein
VVGWQEMEREAGREKPTGHSGIFALTAVRT